MPELRFFHQDVKKVPAYNSGKVQSGPEVLIVSTGPNSITWSYGLNTQTFPTYAGEVVQVLSAYIDNIRITGDVHSYSDLEAIYRWFMEYIEIATQGEGQGAIKGARYNEKPVALMYPERGWRFLIKPISLPGFRYGTDMVVPSWQMEAAVVEPEPKALHLSLEDAMKKDASMTTLPSGIGYSEENPFSDPQWAKKDPTKPEEGEDEAKEEDYDPSESVGKIADWFNNIIKSYLDSDFEAAGISGPASAEEEEDQENEDDET